MSRFKYQSYATDGNGSVITGATISVHLTGTTTVASVYAASSGGVAVNSVTSNATTGYYSFWVDDSDYTGEQFFRIKITKATFGTVTLDDIEVLPLLWAGSGTTGARPTVTTIGMQYMDTTLGQLVIWDGSAWTLFTLVSDTTPQLGGNLDMNTNNIQTVTPTEMTYVHGVTSAIQTQLNTLTTEKVPYTGTAQVPWTKGADVASGTALPILTDGNYFDVTGTTTVTSIDTTGKVGTVIKLHFDDALILTHDATNLFLPGAANITTVAGDEAEFVEYASGDFRCTNYQTASASIVKAWINFNGSGVIAERDSFNVSSITDNGTGNYTITWDTDFANANYSAVATCGSSNMAGIVSMAAGNINITGHNHAGTITNQSIINCIAIGEQV